MMSDVFEAKGDYDNALKYLAKTWETFKGYSGRGLYDISYNFPVNKEALPLRTDITNIDYYTQVLDLTKKLFGENHIRTSRYYNLLGQVFDNVGKKDKAKEYYQKSLDVSNKQSFSDETLMAINKKNIEIIKKSL